MCRVDDPEPPVLEQGAELDREARRRGVGESKRRGSTYHEYQALAPSRDIRVGSLHVENGMEVIGNHPVRHRVRVLWDLYPFFIADVEAVPRWQDQARIRSRESPMPLLLATHLVKVVLQPRPEARPGITAPRYSLRTSPTQGQGEGSKEQLLGDREPGDLA